MISDNNFEDSNDLLINMKSNNIYARHFMDLMVFVLTKGIIKRLPTQIFPPLLPPISCQLTFNFFYFVTGLRFPKVFKCFDMKSV